MRLGIDIGGTKTDAVAIDERSEIVARLRLPTGFGAQAVVDTAVSAIEQLAERTLTPMRAFSSIGIGIPGTVDTTTGVVSHAVNLGVEELDLAAALEARLAVDVRVENDVKAAALGAFQLMFPPREATLEQHSMAYLNLGTGLAAGLVLNGELWRGSRGTAGEIGHIPVDPLGVLCPCGQRGCLETVASGSAIARQWPSDEQIPVLSLLEAARAGNARAQAIRLALVENVAAAVRILVLTVDVEVVVVGGGLSHLGQLLLDEVRSVLDAWARDSPFLASLDLPGRVRFVPDDFPVAAVGAALVGRSLAPVGEL
ncbi:ROK family protein [Agreia sp.]|uniref:ROK family protein n=1 Tax=Agreia sp. TaxID=1872416 RepID=UPI0035BC57CC